MARSRNIKPGFFTNDELAECSPFSRLLFAGLWTIADKEGRLDDRHKRIKAMVLPFDDVDCDQLLQELHNHRFITRYHVGGESYIQISNWKKHQNPHCKEAASEIPAQVKNSESSVQEQGGVDGETVTDEVEDTQPTELQRAQCKSGADTVQEQEKHINDPADSLNPDPDSLNPDPDSLVNTQDADATCDEAEADIHEIASRYAFEGKIVRLNHKDYQAWLTLYPLIDLNYELQKLDIEFSHEKPKNWFITASQKLSYQNKQMTFRPQRKVVNGLQSENFATKNYGQTEVPDWAE